jgi:hypothetical protein
LTTLLGDLGLGRFELDELIEQCGACAYSHATAVVELSWLLVVRVEHVEHVN